MKHRRQIHAWIQKQKMWNVIIICNGNHLKHMTTWKSSYERSKRLIELYISAVCIEQFYLFFLYSNSTTNIDKWHCELDERSDYSLFLKYFIWIDCVRVCDSGYCLCSPSTQHSILIIFIELNDYWFAWYCDDRDSC